MSKVPSKLELYAKSAKPNGGGPFGEIDRMAAAWLETRKKFRAAVKERLGSVRQLRSVDGLYAVKWSGTLYRAPTVEALLEKLPKRGPVGAP